MATDQRDKVAAATEAITGLNRIMFANKTEAYKKQESEEEFVRPVYLKPKDSVRGYISIYSDGGEKLKTFHNIIISNLNSSDMERVARTAVRDGEHRRHLGRAARQITFTAAFFNTFNEPWFDNFIDLWNNWLRGSRLDELKAHAYVKIDERIYKGTFSGYQYAESGENDTLIVSSLIMDVDDVFYNPIVPATAAEQDDAVFKIIYTEGVKVVKDKTL
jgi:hypothetical protein